MTMLRVRFGKCGKVRFTSHRDVARIWERALRRAEINVAYTQGFSPRPRVSFGLALATGQESQAEYLDVDLVDEPVGNHSVWAAELGERLDRVLPEGIDVLATTTVDRSTDSLQQAVESCTWSIEINGVDTVQATRWVEDLLSREEIVVERERKGGVVSEDVRPQVLALGVTGATEHGVRLLADLGTQPRALRPVELLAAIDPPLHARSVRRMHQWMSQGSERIEPLPADAVPGALAEVRA